MGFEVKGSTTTQAKLNVLTQAGITPYLLELSALKKDSLECITDLSDFLSADILVVNIPGKDIEGFVKLASAVAHSPIRKLIFVSSTSVYPQTSGWVTEDQADSNLPLVLIEQNFRQIPSVATTVVRMAGLIGYQRHPGRFFKHGRSIKAPNAPVNLIHCDDCIGILCAIIQQDVWGEVFNAVADTHPTKAQFYTQAAAQACLAPPKMATDDNSGKQVDNQKVKQRLSYRFIHPDLMKIRF